jgi:hypothetical protein
MFPYKLSREFDASFFFVEHRYYGASQPFEDWSTDNLRYLTSRHALADLALFITEVNEKLMKDFGGEKRKVVVIGGSYPGALSAWFKAKYPNVADASWASSAVINAIEDFDKFDYQVYNSTTRSNLYCTGTIQNMTIVFDRMVEQSNRETVDKIKGSFNATHLTDEDFAFFFADMFVLSVQYGGRTKLCDFLESLAGVNIIEQYAKVAEYTKDVGAPSEYDRNSLMNTTVNLNNSGRQWTYQYCTEFGYFQIPYQHVNMRSQLLEHEYWIDYCKAIFGDEVTIRAKETNINYGSTDIISTNTYFVNGGEDPWQWASLLSPKKELNIRVSLLQCENCGHCVELYNEKNDDSKELKQVREDIRKWLKDVLHKHKGIELM